jgi:beta-glucosidase-like glycosyl hydrolase
MKEDKKIIQQFELVLPIQENKNEKKKLIKDIIYIIAITIIYSAIVIIIISLSTNDRNDEEKNDKETETKDSWDISYKKAEEFINKLNLTEQINLLFGTQNMKGKLVKNETEKGFLCNGQIDPFKNKNIDFKGMCLQDGPAGVRFAKGTSISWQASLNTAATFNKQLMYEIGKAQGQENKIKGINTILGPSANMFRSPQGEEFGNHLVKIHFLLGYVLQK